MRKPCIAETFRTRHCKNYGFIHYQVMKSAAWLITSILASAFLIGCAPPIQVSSVGGGTGPFDANGNYREEWADDPSKWRRPSSSSSSSSAVASNTSNRNTSTQVSRPSPPPPKPKPTSTRYTVKSGDTLIGIAKRHGSTVSAIRRANGISGSLIFPGQRLTVPFR